MRHRGRWKSRLGSGKKQDRAGRRKGKRSGLLGPISLKDRIKAVKIDRFFQEHMGSSREQIAAVIAAAYPYDDRAGVQGADRTYHDRPVDAGHAIIGDDHVKGPFAGQKQRLLAVFTAGNLMSAALQGMAQDIAYGLIIINDKDCFA